MSAKYIYKILQSSEWQTLKNTGNFAGSSIDNEDGYIHMSTADQVQGTLDKHYTEGHVLILAQIKASLVTAEIKYETSRGGSEFPHIYGNLNFDAVIQHWPLTPNNKGVYAARNLA